MFYQFNHIGSSTYFTKEYGVNFNFPVHLHNCFEFITVLSGQMQVTVGRNSYSLCAGQGVLIFPNQIHSLASTECRHMLCIFSPKLVTAFFEKHSLYLPKDPVFTPDMFVLEKLDQLPENPDTTVKKGLLYLLCGTFDEKAEYYPAATDKNGLLQKIFIFIEKNFTSECSLYALAKEIGYDHTYVSRYFKKTVGISILEYVNIYRINHACHLLKNTDHTILQCAMESGFASLRNFNRVFKKHLQTTPSQYKKLP